MTLGADGDAVGVAALLGEFCDGDLFGGAFCKVDGGKEAIGGGK